MFYALFGFASDWGMTEGRQVLGLVLLFVARLGAGIAGATVSTAQAVIADSTSASHRGRGMAMIGIAFGLGLTLGPILAGAALQVEPAQLAAWLSRIGLEIPGLAEQTVLRGAPGYAASLLSFLSFMLAVFLMPETLRSRGAGHRRGWLNVSGIRLVLETPTAGILILAFFLSTVTFTTFEVNLAWLTRDLLLFKEKETTYVFAFIGMVLLLTQGGLYQVLARRGVSEISFMILGASFTALGLGSIGCELAWREGWRASSYAPLLLPCFLGSIMLAVSGFALITPSVQALISRRSDPARQGEILGVSQSTNAISRILGPLLGGPLYTLTRSHVLPYALAVVFLGIMIRLTLRARIRANPSTATIGKDSPDARP